MKPLKLLLMSILIASALLLSAARNGVADSPNQRSHSTATPKNNDTGSTPRPTINNQQPSPVPASEKGQAITYDYYSNFNYRPNESGIPWDKIGTVVTVLATVAMALFSGALWITSKWQWETLDKTLAQTAKSAKAAQDSAQVAQDLLASSNQPWLVAENWELIEPAEDVMISATFTFRNFGDGPAWLTSLEVKFAPIDAGTTYKPEPDYRSERPNLQGDIPGTVLAPKEPLKRTVLYEGILMKPEVLRNYRRGLTYLLIVGKVEFEDSRGSPNEMRFSAQFQWNLDGKSIVFRDVGPPSYHSHGRPSTKRTP